MLMVISRLKLIKSGQSRCLIVQTSLQVVRLLTRSITFSVKNELGRLEKNRERRYAREKAKRLHRASLSDIGQADSPGSPSASTPVSGKQGTQRKCANCGQVGHIKTNKKCVPRSVSFALSPSPPSSSLDPPAATKKRKNASSAAGSKKKSKKSDATEINYDFFGPGQ